MVQFFPQLILPDDDTLPRTAVQGRAASRFLLEINQFGSITMRTVDKDNKPDSMHFIVAESFVEMAKELVFDAYPLGTVFTGKGIRTPYDLDLDVDHTGSMTWQSLCDFLNATPFKAKRSIIEASLRSLDNVIKTSVLLFWNGDTWILGSHGKALDAARLKDESDSDD